MQRIAYHLDELDEADELSRTIALPGMPLLGFRHRSAVEPGHLGRRGGRRPERVSAGLSGQPGEVLVGSARTDSTVARSLLITGTDTGIGKTTVASAIAAALRRRGRDVGVIKPVETGCRAGRRRGPDSGGRAAAALGGGAGRSARARLSRTGCAPRSPRAWRRGARACGSSCRSWPTACARRSRACELALVEGAGGLLVPLTDSATFADLARACGLRLLVVVGNRLGALNHARLTLDWARAAGLDVAGYVVNTLRPESRPRRRDQRRRCCASSAARRSACSRSSARSAAAKRIAHALADAAERSLDLDALL